LPEIALDDDHTPDTLMKLDYVPATLPGGAEGVRLKFSSRIVNKAGSLVQLFTEDSGATWYFDLDSATKTKLAKIAVLEASLAFTDASVAAVEADVAVIEDDIAALQGDLLTLDNRIGFAEEDIDTLEGRADLLEENQTTIFDLLIAHGGDLDEHAEAINSLDTAISGASIECDSSGVTLTWGTPAPPGAVSVICAL
jgi:hypothetical protein